MNTWKVANLISIILIACYISSASATNYNEAVDGDIRTYPPQLIDLETGINTITGTVNFFEIPPSPNDHRDTDNFVIHVPDGYTAGFDFDFSIDVGSSPNYFGFAWEINELIIEGDCSIYCNDIYLPFASEIFASHEYDFTLGDVYGDINISDITSLSSGYYYFTQVGYTELLIGQRPLDHVYTMDYTVTLDIRSVPVPPSILLFLSGLFFIFRSKSSKTNCTGLFIRPNSGIPTH